MIEQWIIDLISEADKKAFEIMVEQYKQNPEAIEALYG